MERQSSFRLGALEKLKIFRGMEKQKSFRMTSMERRSRDSPGKRGDTPLHLAARPGSVAHAQRILAELDRGLVWEMAARQNQDGETPLYVTAEKGHAEVVREILKVSDVQTAGIKANNSFDAFHIAAKQGHLEVLKEMLQAFPALAMTTNSVNATALDTAAIQGHVDIVNLLLETDASLAKIARNNGKTVLHSAARMGHVEVVRSLLSKDPGIGLRTDKKGQTALHMASKGQDAEIVVELFKPDASVIHIEDNKWNRPLHVATRKGNTDGLTQRGLVRDTAPSVHASEFMDSANSTEMSGSNPPIASPRVYAWVACFKLALDCFFAVWFVVGNVWIFGSRSSIHDAPNLYRICIVFLAFGFVGYLMPFVLCTMICCCLPCIISVLRFHEDMDMNRGAAAEAINALVAYKFQSRKIRDGDVVQDGGGVLAAGTEKERTISAEDAICCICLSKFSNDEDLRELPCAHVFHMECVDKWLQINALCPLCKAEIGGSASVPKTASQNPNRDSRVEEDVESQW